MTETTRQNPIIFEFDKLTAEYPGADFQPMYWLECLTAFQNGIEWPITDWMNELIDLVDTQNLGADDPVVTEARILLARRVLATTDNPILVDYRSVTDAPETREPAAAALTALGGFDETFLRYLYDSTSPAFRENQRVLEPTQLADDSRIVLAALALPAAA